MLTQTISGLPSSLPQPFELTTPRPDLNTPSLPTAPVLLLHKHLISDEDFDSLSSLAVEESVSVSSDIVILKTGSLDPKYSVTFRQSF